MSNQHPIRNGITYVLNGERVYLTATDSNNRVRMMRVAQGKGATDIHVIVNGRAPFAA
jgi:hypothetical protein